MSAPLPSDSVAARFGRRLLILCALLALALFILVSFFPSRHWDGFDGPYALRYGLILIFLALGLAASRRRLGAMAAELGLWFAILLVLAAGYSYRYALQDLARGVTAQLVPSRGIERSPGVVSFNRADDGQFWIEAKVDGVPVRFLVDTGATDVVLSSADAERLGYDLDRLTFSQEADTANGRVREAPIVLGRLAIGSIRFERVPAAISVGGLRSSLLGMRLLERLSSVEIRRDTLTIRE